MDNNFDRNGLDALGLAVINQAREDYVGGYQVMMDNFGKVLTRDEYLVWWANNKSKKTRTMSYNKYKDINDDIEAYHSAIKFLKEDPYEVFQIHEDILKTWDELAKENYAKVLEERALA